MAQSYGGVGTQEMLREPTDLLLYAEWNDRKSVQRLIDQYGDRLPSFVVRYLPEIREKLLDRPRMTREDFREGDPRIKAWGEEIIIELDGEAVTFKPLPEGCDKINIPSRDGLVWEKDRLVLPDSGKNTIIPPVSREEKVGVRTRPRTTKPTQAICDGV